MNLSLITANVIPASAKWAFTTRRVNKSDVVGLSTDFSHAVPGDLVLGQIITLGQHRKIQLAEGRLSESYTGDYIVVACGDRYAPDQFEGVAELDPEGADLIAGGGLLGRMRAAHIKMIQPTRVKPLGLLLNRQGETINIANYSLPMAAMPKDITVIGVVGASMNAGKTTAAVSLAHGLSRAGLKVAGIKATGTGAFGDYNAFRDAGIPIVADFTDAGMASTYRQPIDRIEEGFKALIAHAAAEGAEVAVVELADGIFQLETAELLRASIIRDSFSGVMFAAPDALGAVGGVAHLRQLGLEPFAVSGMVSCSPLAIAEAEAVTQVRIASRDELRDPACATELVSGFMSISPVAPSEAVIGYERAA
ncbi:MAG: molybdopterin-guanine dinucleotide biosynthesis protein B [Candidatus Competibacteraceae bacterium]|nr:molybdopterin-guanine dinucleotide biosynthesis protein B [Candidatus Competibacteraceae bacterium]